MFDLDTIIRMNDAAASRPAPESETTRHCSICRARGGVVLHSAKQRSTVFLSGIHASAFLRQWDATSDVSKRDRMVEARFIS